MGKERGEEEDRSMAPVDHCMGMVPGIQGVHMEKEHAAPAALEKHYGAPVALEKALEHHKERVLVLHKERVLWRHKERVLWHRKEWALWHQKERALWHRKEWALWPQKERALWHHTERALWHHTEMAPLPWDQVRQGMWRGILAALYLVKLRNCPQVCKGRLHGCKG
jgi:hypothetical protein